MPSSFDLNNPESKTVRRRKALNIDHTEEMSRHPDVFSRHHIGAISASNLDDNRWTASSENDWSVEVVRFRENVLRLKISPTREFERFPTYALSNGVSPSGSLDVAETSDHFTFSCGNGQLVLAKADGKFSTTTTRGEQTLTCSTPPHALSSIMAGRFEIGASFAIENIDVQYHGLGDKPGHLDMHGRRYTMWNTDAFGYSEDSDEIYKSIPFVLAEHGDKRIGLLFDNTHKATFDFGKTENKTFSYTAEGGELCIYFFFAEDPIQICADYCKLTGTPPMPPLWALGYQQCRWSYYPEARVREVVNDFREKEFPCDAIYLDIDYMDAYKCFTHSEVLFPNLKEMIADFRDVDMRTVVMIDPGISAAKGYDVYEQGTDNDVWCRRTSGEIMRGPVWPAECVFPDYTRKDVRDWWGKLYDGLYNTMGVSGFWNDMNEPAVFKVNRATFPDEVMHDMDGHPGTHARAHNIYGLKMTEASYEGLRKLQPAVRPFLLTRATYAGGQRYAAVWTGDNTASWRHLAVANHQCIRLSLCGFSLTGSDIGGFNQDPDGELYTRWVQLAIFHPVMRTHSMGNNADGATQTDQDAVAKAAELDRRDQEPWSYGEPYTSHCREAINWRYRLLPSLYTAMEALHRHGTPILVPSYMEDVTDQKLVSQNAFRFGQHLFVDPCMKEGQAEQRTYLPKGTWYHLQSGKRYEGRKEYQMDTPLSFIPAFVRGGSVVQLDPVRQSTAAAYASPPELHVYHADGLTNSSLYLDEGEGYGFEKGDFLRSTFTYSGESSVSRLTAKQEGSFTPAFESYELVWHGSGKGDWELSVDGKPVSAQAVGDTYRATIPVRFSSLEMRQV